MGELFRRTGRLFARPSFVEGMARLMDWGGSLNEYNRDKDGPTADANALRSDWAAVGDAFYASIDEMPSSASTDSDPIV